MLPPFKGISKDSKPEWNSIIPWHPKLVTSKTEWQQSYKRRGEGSCQENSSLITKVCNVGWSKLNMKTAMFNTNYMSSKLKVKKTMQDASKITGTMFVVDYITCYEPRTFLGFSAAYIPTSCHNLKSVSRMSNIFVSNLVNFFVCSGNC